MTIKVTDCERIAVVTPTQLGQFECPKCLGVCNEYIGPARLFPTRREWTCVRCGRGWVQVPIVVTTVKQAMESMEE